MNMEKYREELKQKLIESAAKVVYTYTAHWKIVDRLQYWNRIIKITQFSLIGISSCGLLSILFDGFPYSKAIIGICSFLSLSTTLYSLNFNLPDQIKQHTNAANELWYIRELYVSLITDFDILSLEEIQIKRDKLTEKTNHVNKTYPGTDTKSYEEARNALQQQEEQTFNEGEAEKILNLKTNSCFNEKDAQSSNMQK